MTLKSNSEVVPYWGKGKEAKMGLNQLGMRTLVEAIFATLLPGMNNVTGRIRYYSFYCWLLKQFKDTGAGPDGVYHQKDFITFIRKAEYLLATINYFSKDRLGIPGNTYVAYHIDDDAVLVDLSKGIITESGDYHGSYWANKWGILGQYYLSSITDLSLLGRVQADGDFFGVTSSDEGCISGEEFADAFTAGVGSDGAVFLNCIKQSYVTKEEAKQLVKTFDMHSYATSEEERSLTIRCLMQKDYPSIVRSGAVHRRETIKYILEYFKAQPVVQFNDQDFARWMYDKYHNGSTSGKTLTGWYAYYMEESWQYLSSVVFTDILNKLSDDEWSRISDVADTVASEICEFICLDSDTKASLNDALKSLPEVTKFKSPAEAYAQILHLFLENRQDIDTVKTTPGFSVLYSDAPDDIFAYFRRIEGSLDVKFKEFVKDYILEKIIYRHYQISFIKQRQTGISSQKFLIERGCMKRIMKYGYTHTSPRLDTLVAFLTDLGAIDGKAITALGEQILTDYSNEN